MVPGIDVYFTGLMLICIAGQPECPKENTAWVVKADGTNSLPCGWKSDTTTTLQLRFKRDDFCPKEADLATCVPNCRADNNDKTMVVCELEDTKGPQHKVCI